MTLLSLTDLEEDFRQTGSGDFPDYTTKPPYGNRGVTPAPVEHDNGVLRVPRNLQKESELR